MKRIIMKKIHSQKGETLAELLIAMLISVLALTMLAFMISATLDMVTKSKNKMNDYYIGSKVLEVQENPTDGNITIASIEDETVNQTIPIKLYENTEYRGIYTYQIGSEE